MTNRVEYGFLALIAGVIAIWLIGSVLSANMAMAQVPSPCIDNPELCKDATLSSNNPFSQFFIDVFDGLKFMAGLIFDGLKYAYDAFGDYFFSRTPLPIAPIDLDSVPSSPGQTQEPAPQTCYSYEVVLQKYSECGRTFQTKREAALSAGASDAQIRIYGDEYDACTNAVSANKCR